MSGNPSINTLTLNTSPLVKLLVSKVILTGTITVVGEVILSVASFGSPPSIMSAVFNSPICSAITIPPCKI